MKVKDVDREVFRFGSCDLLGNQVLAEDAEFLDAEFNLLMKARGLHSDLRSYSGRDIHTANQIAGWLLNYANNFLACFTIAFKNSDLCITLCENGLLFKDHCQKKLEESCAEAIKFLEY